MPCRGETHPVCRLFFTDGYKRGQKQLRLSVLHISVIFYAPLPPLPFPPAGNLLINPIFSTISIRVSPFFALYRLIPPRRMPPLRCNVMTSGETDCQVFANQRFVCFYSLYLQ